MNKIEIQSEVNLGEQMFSLIEELYPICRSITGDGVRKTLHILKERIPLEISEVPTGMEVFDWMVPKEWNINNAWITDSKGNKIVDFQDSNLHVLNYSIPVDKKVTLEELKDHLYTLPDHPDWIPYRTSYYRERWGFCLEYSKFKDLKDEQYHVYIDSSLEPGHLTYGELLIEGDSEEEILISSHVCHPSLCNDNLSGISVAVQLAKKLLELNNRYSYRFLFIPGTIGSITWLALNENKLSSIKQGLVLSCVGDKGHVHWKKTRQESSEVDRAVEKVLEESGDPFDLLNFLPYGYDERQFSSPGINLNVGCFMRSQWGTFPEYHTSADNLEFVQPEFLEDSYYKLWRILQMLDQNNTYINLNPKCEPQLGRRGLYSKTGGDTHFDLNQMAVLWVLNLSDGTNSLLDISKRSDISFESIRKAADALIEVDLLKEANNSEVNKIKN